MQDILDEDMGIQFEIENLPDLESQMVLLTADDASVESYGTAWRDNSNKENQMKDSALC